MSGGDGCLATGFKDVDANGDIEKFVACLEFIAGMPASVAYKARTYEMMNLRPGDVVADVGCGLGLDVAELARRVAPGGMAVGLDGSEKFLRLARQRFSGDNGGDFLRCDVHRLPLASNSLDSLRCDRTLQHVAEPHQVIAEMARALKPGGWLVCAEPDWSTFVIDSPDDGLAELVAATWRRRFRNPEIGRRLPRLLAEHGLGEARAADVALLASGFHAANLVYDIAKTADLMMRSASQALAGRLAAWLQALRASDGPAVSASVSIFLASGRKAA